VSCRHHRMSLRKLVLLDSLNKARHKPGPLPNNAFTFFYEDDMLSFLLKLSQYIYSGYKMFFFHVKDIKQMNVQ
jgi:hypothetical protein